MKSFFIIPLLVVFVVPLSAQQFEISKKVGPDLYEISSFSEKTSLDTVLVPEQHAVQYVSKTIREKRVIDTLKIAPQLVSKELNNEGGALFIGHSVVAAYREGIGEGKPESTVVYHSAQAWLKKTITVSRVVAFREGKEIKARNETSTRDEFSPGVLYAYLLFLIHPVVFFGRKAISFLDTIVSARTFWIWYVAFWFIAGGFLLVLGVVPFGMLFALLGTFLAFLVAILAAYESDGDKIPFDAGAWFVIVALVISVACATIVQSEWFAFTLLGFLIFIWIGSALAKRFAWWRKGRRGLSIV